MPQEKDKVRQNSILANLSEETYQRLEPNLSVSHLSLNDQLYQPIELITKVYFPTTAILSWVSLLESGTLTEIAIVANTGVAGLPALWGGDHTPNSLIVQLAGNAFVIDAPIAAKEFKRGGEFNQAIARYTQAMLTQVSQNVVCNQHHTTEERLARWLLSVQDGVQQEDQKLTSGSASSKELALTQEFMAKMLGVRRSSVSLSASILQQAGLIRYRRGRLTIVDRAGLEEVSCECYRLVKHEYDRLLNP